jgi:DNA-binding CsgD family transcriptional regulator
LDAHSAGGPPVTTEDLLATGRSALRSGDAAGARRAFAAALEESPGDGDVLEGLARAAYIDLDFAGAIEHWHAAYAAHRAAGDHVGAVRVARTLGYLHGAVMGDGAVMSGWIARAQTLLAGAPDSAEAGWVSLTLGMFEGDRARKEGYFTEALAVARRVGDADLEFVTLAYLGASLVHADRTEEGMVLLDEALAAVDGGEVDDFLVLEEIFCQLFSACERAHDVGRADQWMRVGEEIASRRNLPAVSAFCRTHYGGVLTAAGRWPEADAALTEAVRLWGLGYRSLRAGALIRLADLRVRQGRFEEADQLLDGLRDEVDAARAVAAIELARTRTALARHVLDRALESVDATSAAAAPLLAQLVDVHLAAGELGEAAAAAEQLARCAELHQSDYLLATAALVRGLVCLATGVGDPRVRLNEALAGFARAQMPMEVARSRFELATALATDRPEAAIAEARAALEAFDRLQAARHADAAAALLRSLGARTASAKRGGELLTRREAEVLELVGHGLSNPEIADRLYISRKTVEHHVGNILAKLGLRSRAEAAAYATRTGPAEK